MATSSVKISQEILTELYDDDIISRSFWNILIIERILCFAKMENKHNQGSRVKKAFQLHALLKTPQSL